jgi:hypothetical protein
MPSGRQPAGPLEDDFLSEREDTGEQTRHPKAVVNRGGHPSSERTVSCDKRAPQCVGAKCGYELERIPPPRILS